MRLPILVLLSFLGACGLATTRPKTEMSLAQAAFLAAKEAGADTRSPTIYRKAEVFYLKAKSAYRRKYFNKAQEYALLSKKFSEQAEYEAKRKEALEGSNP
ncbi:MAG: DUF4398 domain-containing protein [Bacteriovoracia bacterium]